MNNGVNCVHVWMRNAFSLNNPLFSIGGFEKPTVGVFFCRGWKWRVREGGDWEWVFCILTTDEVHVFGTGEQGVPLWVGRNYHLSVLTDASWRGSQLIVTSTDGFASVFGFGWPGLEVEEKGEMNGVEAEVMDNVDNRADSAESQESVVDNGTENGAECKKINPKIQHSVSEVPITHSTLQTIVHSEMTLDNQTTSKPVSTQKKRITPTLITSLE